MENKFIFFQDSKNIDGFLDFANRNVYIEQAFEKFNRLVIWPSGGAIEVLKKLIEHCRDPYHILYILKESCCNNEPARYTKSDVSSKELECFLSKFSEFLEYDSRHRIVIRILTEELTYFVYDEENFILAYGNIEMFKSILSEMGFEEYAKPMAHPDPHMHMFQKEFNEKEDELLSFFNWKKSPLKDIDKMHIG